MKTKSQLRYGVGMWPDGYAPADHPPELTVAAKRLAEAAIAELKRFGVAITLDKTGKARFRVAKTAPLKARLEIERHGDLITTYLVERHLAQYSVPSK